MLRPEITDDMERFLAVLPPEIQKELKKHDLTDLIEVVLDLGRRPEARFPNHFIYLGKRNITKEDLNHVTEQIGKFGDDNRAGIERTLHRISAIRNRDGEIIGLTCRVGRAIYGTIDIIRDIIEAGKNVLLLGRPGVGKTTMLREVARVLADEFSKRVVIVDTSNEIAGDGDIPHPAIGRARRMQVPTPTRQHDVMIEAVENHMPEVIVIDEIGTSMEAEAARTIAERGVQLIGTAHGNTLKNLVLNPTLSDLVGGIQTVTLGDEEARKRGTQKTVLERKAPPTFDVVIEIQDKDRLAVHRDTGKVVDLLLRGIEPQPEIRVRNAPGEVEVIQESNLDELIEEAEDEDRELGRIERAVKNGGPLLIFPYGVGRSKLEKAASELGLWVQVIKTLKGAHLVISTKGQERKNPRKLQDANQMGIPVYVVRSNTKKQLKDLLLDLLVKVDPEGQEALREAQEAANHVLDYYEPVELSPQSARLRKLQHELAKRNNLKSKSLGKEPNRRVMIYL